MKNSLFKQAMGLAMIFTTAAHAGGISSPVGFPSAKVLPQGVRNIQYKGIYAQGNDKYNQTGDSVKLGESFDKVLTYQDLVDNEETVQDQLFAEAKVNNTPGISLGDSMGNTTGEVNLAVNVHTPVVAYGLTKNWTMAVAVPIVESDLNVDVGSASNESLQKAADILSQPGQGFQGKLEQIQSKFANATQNKLRDNGYDYLEDQKKTELGDMQVISKYNFYQDRLYTVTMQNSVTLPTGKKADINKLVDVGSGDEQLDAGMGVAADINFTSDVVLSGSINYLVQLPDHTEMRIRKDESKITPDKDENTKRDLGDIFQTAIAGKVKFLDYMTVQTGYSYQRKQEDKYSGSKYEASRYDLLSEETEQEMHAVQAGITFDTISMYRKKEFAVPMEVGFGYSKPIAGKNVINDGLLTANLSVYF